VRLVQQAESLPLAAAASLEQVSQAHSAQARAEWALQLAEAL
jgi:hypothetical protein